MDIQPKGMYSSYEYLYGGPFHNKTFSFSVCVHSENFQNILNPEKLPKLWNSIWSRFGSHTRVEDRRWTWGVIACLRLRVSHWHIDSIWLAVQEAQWSFHLLLFGSGIISMPRHTWLFTVGSGDQIQGLMVYWLSYFLTLLISFLNELFGKFICGLNKDIKIGLITKWKWHCFTH